MSPKQLKELFRAPEYSYLRRIRKIGTLGLNSHIKWFSMKNESEIDWKMIPRRVQMIKIRKGSPLVKMHGCHQFYDIDNNCFVTESVKSYGTRPGMPESAQYTMGYMLLGNDRYYRYIPNPKRITKPILQKWNKTWCKWDDMKWSMPPGASLVLKGREMKESNVHPHAALIAEWIQDTTIKIQHECKGKWVDCIGNPTWHMDEKYRKKPTALPKKSFMKEYHTSNKTSVANMKIVKQYHEWLDSIGALKAKVEI